MKQRILNLVTAHVRNPYKAVAKCLSFDILEASGVYHIPHLGITARVWLDLDTFVAVKSDYMGK